MDSDSIISILLLFAFFVLPSILKKIKGKKTKTATLGKPRKKSFILGRISDQIRQFIQKLEDQARLQKQADKIQGTVWETLAEDEKLPQSLEKLEAESDVGETEPDIFEPPEKTQTQPQPPKPSIADPIPQTAGQRNYRVKSNPLQNAVVWSEILSKPVALRDKR